MRIEKVIFKTDLYKYEFFILSYFSYLLPAVGSSIFKQILYKNYIKSLKDPVSDFFLLIYIDLFFYKFFQNLFFLFFINLIKEELIIICTYYYSTTLVISKTDYLFGAPQFDLFSKKQIYAAFYNIAIIYRLLFYFYLFLKQLCNLRKIIHLLLVTLYKFNLRSYPTKKKLFTILKSPHVHKKAREQYFLIYNKLSWLLPETSIRIDLTKSEWPILKSSKIGFYIQKKENLYAFF